MFIQDSVFENVDCEMAMFPNNHQSNVVIWLERFKRQSSKIPILRWQLEIILSHETLDFS